MPSFEEMIDDEASIIVTYRSLAVEVAYYPGRVSDDVIVNILKAGEVGQEEIIAGAGFASINDLLVSLVKSWDLTKTKTDLTMFPLEVDELRKLPAQFRSAVLWAIVNDMRPNSATPQAQTPSS
jgi:hypothetical protein